ncbi:MAG: hypothetical protein OEZ58_04095 [Gammaproteobacteria bacterium]|nr:hypothetical protein [Gammaproteobacteria bacterium]MDH5728145.1 hypothetical protein [Gammaproteobacteria bacterium]
MKLTTITELRDRDLNHVVSPTSAFAEFLQAQANGQLRYSSLATKLFSKRSKETQTLSSKGIRFLQDQLGAGELFLVRELSDRPSPLAVVTDGANSSKSDGLLWAKIHTQIRRVSQRLLRKAEVSENRRRGVKPLLLGGRNLLG